MLSIQSQQFMGNKYKTTITSNIMKSIHKELNEKSDEEVINSTADSNGTLDTVFSVEACRELEVY